jgi:hypothetical protein
MISAKRGQAGQEQMLWWSATTGTPAARRASQPSTTPAGGSTISTGSPRRTRSPGMS